MEKPAEKPAEDQEQHPRDKIIEAWGLAIGYQNAPLGDPERLGSKLLDLIAEARGDVKRVKTEGEGE